jgi:hypothetical protein
VSNMRAKACSRWNSRETGEACLEKYKDKHGKSRGRLRHNGVAGIGGQRLDNW